MVINKIKVISKISKCIGFTSLCYYLNRDRKRVIAYHNIIPDKLFDNSLHLAHSLKESDFRKHLEVINLKFDIDLDLKNSKSVTITFDDGYLNQYEIGSKILDKIKVKGIFFCAEDLINNKKPLDMDMIQFWISYVKTGTYKLDKIGTTLEIENNNRSEEWKKISDRLLEKNITTKEVLEILNGKYSIERIVNENKELYDLRLTAIGIDFLDEMKLKGHLIGAHSSKHNRLSNLSSEELEKDINLCGKNLGKIYNTDIFCYPYGSEEDISEEVIEKLKYNGFKKSFLYGNFPLKKFKYNKYLMPRMVLPTTCDEDVIHFTLSGAKNMILFRKRLPKL